MAEKVIDFKETEMKIAADDIRTAYEKTQAGLAEWRSNTMALAQALLHGRELLDSDNAFHAWLVSNQLDIIKRHDREALLNMARNPAVAAKVINTTDRTSWQYIWEREIKLQLGWVPLRKGTGQPAPLEARLRAKLEKEYEKRRRELEKTFDDRVVKEANNLARQMYDEYRQKIQLKLDAADRTKAEADNILAHYKFPFTNAEFEKIIRKAIHPDTAPGSECRKEAFILIEDRKKVLRPDVDPERKSEPLPETIDELYVRRAANKAETKKAAGDN